MTSPSLLRGLMLNMLLPAAALSLALGMGGTLLIHTAVQAAHDKLLDGSVLAIAERVTTNGGEINVDIPPVALEMLESRAQDRVYYSIRYDGETMTGYPDLPLPDMRGEPANTTMHLTVPYRGSPIRMSVRTRQLYGKPNMAVVAVAETTDARDGNERQLFAALFALEAALLLVVGLLTWSGLARGLAPLAALNRQIMERSGLRCADLRPLPLRGIPRDVSQTVLAFNALLDRLGLSMMSIRQFTGDASHQLRTPLAILRTHLELVRRNVTGTPMVRSALDDAEEATKRLERLVRQLLVLAKADESIGDRDAEATCDVAACVTEIASSHVPDALAASVEIAVVHPAHSAVVRAEGVIIGEIVRNLLENAVQHSPPNGKVVVRTNSTPAGVVLEIEDGGPGIPEHEKERVFERFYRIPKVGGPLGSGLGLAIVRTLAENIGAEVALMRPPYGQGLLVKVLFRTP